MTIAFELDASPGEVVRTLRGAVVALAGAGFALAAWLAPWPWSGAMLVAALPACALAWRYGGRRLAAGRLSVDAAGQCRWQTGTGQRADVAQPVRVERWYATERLVWIRFSENAAHRRRDTLIARDACGPAQWRSLRTWLTWLGRGAT
ncbi:MAG: hypothetical protein KJZ98_00990 [Burkholderiaceae bacterium]|nr:hypothetical protein [Burkholderiaceae bacterium]MEB2349865.1 hypothetical protein [Burkholderiaceae bacterium]